MLLFVFWKHCFHMIEVILFQYYLQMLILFVKYYCIQSYYCPHVLKILFSDDRSNTISILFTNVNTIFINIIVFNLIIACTFWKYYFPMIEVIIFQYYLQMLIIFVLILLHSILLLPARFDNIIFRWSK